MKNNQRQVCDFLVVGSGLAGLFTALKAAPHGKVIVVTKRESDECNTRYAQGGVACVTAEGDSFDSHVADTLKAGGGLCHPDVVERVVSAGPGVIQDLLNWGVRFTTRGDLGGEKDVGNEFDLGKEGGHSKRRILHAGDITGEELIRALTEKCHEDPNIELLEDHLAIDLITSRHLSWQDEHLCLGAYVLNRDGNHVRTIVARHTFLATGGAGKVYLYTSNPDVASGDGIAMAYRAGAEIRNMEFFQFHPTCLYHPEAKSFLISEAVRGEGAELKIRRGGEYVTFMDAYHELGSLAPRDVVARAIDNELKRRGEECAYLDIRHHDETFLRTRFPNIFAECLRFGFNMAEQLIPVVPAAHYCCGGVKTDVAGRTTIKRLYAVGETGSTGLHGANRLASNSLLEAMVVAQNAVADAVTGPERDYPFEVADIPNWFSGNAVDSDDAVVIAHNWDEIRRLMWSYVGIVRSDKRLERAKNRIRLLRNEIEKYYWDFIITGDLVELRNIASVAEMIIDCAMTRRESRGLHFNLDCPETSGETGKDTVLRRPTRAEIWSE